MFPGGDTALKLLVLELFLQLSIAVFACRLS